MTQRLADLALVVSGVARTRIYNAQFNPHRDSEVDVLHKTFSEFVPNTMPDEDQDWIWNHASADLWAWEAMGRRDA